MRLALLKAASLALLCLHVGTASRAGVEVRTVFEDNGHVVVQLNNYYPANQSPAKYFYVAISHSGAYSVKYFRGAWTPPGKAAPPEASAALDTLEVEPPLQFRGARVLPIVVTIPANTSVCRVEVTYAPAATLASGSSVDPLVRDLVMNRNTVPVQPAPGAPQPWFSRGDGWAKLAVSERGMYAVTGADLSAAGISLQAIDPATMRLYSHGGIAQPRDLTAPTGSWHPDQAMREVAIRVEAGSDGTFDPGDRIIFYGVGTRDWADYYDASAPDTVFYEHERALTNYYYLSWGGTLPGAPVRVGDVDATPVAAPDRTSYTQREYRERDLIADYNLRGDGWLWLDVADKRPYTLASVTVTHLVSSVPQEFFTLALSPYQVPPEPASDNLNHHAVYRRSQGAQVATIGERVWSTQPGENYYENGLPVRIAGNFLVPGDNQISFQVPRDLNPNDEQRFAWFAVRYERRIVATGDAIAFSTPDSTGAINLRARGFSTGGTLYAFDVTDPWSPARLTGADVSTAGSERTLRVGFDLAGRRQLWAGTGAAFRKPALTRVAPSELRAEPAPANMLIITHRDMRGAADRLRAYRAAGHVPGYSNPVVKVVTTDEIFDNFSGGMPDAMGIRNYIKYLFDNFRDANGYPRLAYVLLLGDANEDFQNHASSQPDFVPSNLYFTRRTVFAFSTDEWFGHMDAEDQVEGHGVLDLAIGRLPAASADEAAFLVDRVIGYESGMQFDTWRQRCILVADDENSSFSSCENQWPQDSETITLYRASNFLDIHKIYLTEYPAIAGVKPTARREFIDTWNSGAMIVNYIGHGSPVQMADEQVFLEGDVSQLTNGLRLPVVMAYSCTIGQFASPAGKCLSEKLLLHEGGGAIATVTASNETYSFPNQRTCFAMFDAMVPDRPGRDPQRPIGVSLMHAKLYGQVDTHWQGFQEENTWKYNLLGDPALSPATPRDEVRFEVAAPETLVAGARHALRGAVYNGGVLDSSFDGPVFVTIREPEVRQVYSSASCPGLTIRYNLPGGPIYQGTVDAVDGKFEVSFRVPRYAATGTLGHADAYAHDSARDAAVAADSLLLVVAPTLADSLALKPVDGAPRVDLGFKSGLQVVKPGDTVRARVADADGINILNTTNEGRQAILLDNLPIPIDVNEFFTFDHGGTDTTGTLLYPLPDLAVGKHRLVYKVSDSFGFTTLDTLQFSVTDAANYYAESAFNYPNPFSDSTQFLFRVSNRAEIKLELYTVSGKFVRRIEETRDGGEVWVRWDGRDAGGGDVANGSYLYVATIDFVGVDRPPVVLRGALSRIR